MKDRETVIKGLTACTQKDAACEGSCPYYRDGTEWGDGECVDEMMRDALALLKEQEGDEIPFTDAAAPGEAAEDFWEQSDDFWSEDSCE